MAKRNPVAVARARPAETATPVVMAAAMLVASLTGLDEAQTAYLAIILAFVPAAVTWAVDTFRK